MRKLIEEKIVELYKKLDLTVSIAEFKAELTAYLQEEHPVLKSASTIYVLWATPVFASWMEESGTTVQTLIEDITKFVFGSIIILRLPMKTHRALWNNDLRFLSDIKEFVTNPQNLVSASGLGIDAVEEILKSYSKHMLTVSAT